MFVLSVSVSGEPGAHALHAAGQSERKDTVPCLALACFSGSCVAVVPDWYLHFVEDLIKAVCFKWQISSGGIDVSTVFGK